MPQRKVWSAQEDHVLKYLREQCKIPKWSIIARKMQEEHAMPGRTGKQCRERYHNHLDSSIVRSQWSRQEQQFLYGLHNQVGNKWAIIAQKMPGRSDNCVKNHFYSKMRKAVRKLNKVIHEELKRDFKQIKMNVLYKIVEAADQKFKPNSEVQNDTFELCFRLKNLLLEYSNDQENSLDGNLARIKELASEIHKFNSQFHKKKKKVRRGSLTGQQILALPKFQIKPHAFSQNQSDSQYSMVMIQEEVSDMEIQQKMEKKVYQAPLGEVQEIPEQLKQSNYSSGWHYFNPKDSNNFGVDSLKMGHEQIHKSNNTIKNNSINKDFKDLGVKLSMSSDHAEIQNMLMNEGALRFDNNNHKNLLEKLPKIGGAGKSSDGGSFHGDDMFEMEEQNANMQLLGQSMEGLKIKDFDEDDLRVVDDQDKLFVST